MSGLWHPGQFGVHELELLWSQAHILGRFLDQHASKLKDGGTLTPLLPRLVDLACPLASRLCVCAPTVDFLSPCKNQCACA